MGRWLLLADYFQGLEQERRARMKKGGRTGEAEGGDERGREEAPYNIFVGAGHGCGFAAVAGKVDK